MKCKTCGAELTDKQKWIKIPELKIEVEREFHFKNIKLRDIKIPKGMRVLTITELLTLWNNHRDKFEWDGEMFDEVIENPFKDFREKYPLYNLWFRCVDGRSDLYGYDGNLYCDCGTRGVRFVTTAKSVNVCKDSLRIKKVE